MILLYGVASGLDVVCQLALFVFIFEVTCKEKKVNIGGSEFRACKTPITTSITELPVRI
jgi:hypothetical protein